MTGREVAAAIKKFEAIKEKIAADRDDLRTLIDEMEDILDSTDRAQEAFIDAIDALSELL